VAEGREKDEDYLTSELDEKDEKREELVPV